MKRLSLGIMILTVILALPPGAPAAGDGTARGTVFEDVNGDGVRGPAEPGVSGVLVSNGREVVPTGPDGSYRLPVGDDVVLFITKPAGYAVPLSDRNLPRFYYVHRPAGAPALQFRGVGPTGGLPGSIDFPLRCADEPSKFRAAVLADTQPETSQEVLYVQDDVLSELAGKDFAFGITLGDILFDDLGLAGMYNDAVGRVGVPFYHVIGNHDMNFDAATDWDSMSTYIRLYGPPNYSFDVGQVHFVVLDSIIYRPPGPGGGGYDEGFDEAALTWLANDLRHVDPEKLVVLCTHAPLRDAPPGGTLGTAAGDLFALLKDRERVLSLSGHTHYCYFHDLGPEDGWEGEGRLHQANLVTVSGSWWGGPADQRGIPAANQRDGVPNGYTIVDFDGPDYTISYKAAGMPPDHQMTIYPPGWHRNGDAPRRTVLANVYYAMPGASVEYSLDGAPFRPMTYAPQYDPLAVRYYGDVVNTGKPWVGPATAHHIWEARLDGAPSKGSHRVDVRADIGGRSHTQSLLFYTRW